MGNNICRNIEEQREDVQINMTQVDPERNLDILYPQSFNNSDFRLLENSDIFKKCPKEIIDNINRVMNLHPQYFQFRKKYQVNYDTYYNEKQNIYYMGELEDEKKDGWGCVLKRNQKFFEGQYSKDRLNGFGVYVSKFGDYYVGEFKEGQFDGDGHYKD